MEHHSGSHQGSCCSVSSKIYIPEKDFTSVDRAIHDILTSKHYFRDNLKSILDNVDKAQTSLLKRSAEKGIELDGAMKKELLSKCLLEAVNRRIFTDVYNALKAKEQSISKQPGLVAHPQTVRSMPDCRLDQLTAEQFGAFIADGSISVHKFFDATTYDSVCKPLVKQMTLFEMEGKFDVRRPVSATKPANRSDKFFDFNLSQLEGVDEVKMLRQLTRLLFFLPYEINSKMPLSLQVSETF